MQSIVAVTVMSHDISHGHLAAVVVKCKNYSPCKVRVCSHFISLSFYYNPYQNTLHH